MLTEPISTRMTVYGTGSVLSILFTLTETVLDSSNIRLYTGWVMPGRTPVIRLKMILGY